MLSRSYIPHSTRPCHSAARWSQAATRCLASVTLVSSLLGSPATAQIPGTRVPGGCDVPVAQRDGEIGCYLVATQPLATHPADPLYWHIYAFPTRAAAERAAGQATGVSLPSVRTVVTSLGRAWLFVLAGAEWRAPGEGPTARIGPLVVPPGARLVARYMEAVIPPGMQTAVHRHSGPEAWYLVAGAQCLQTPDSTIIARAGHGAVVPAGPAMRLSGIGSETRRSLLLVVHDATQPWMTMVTDWTPHTNC